MELSIMFEREDGGISIVHPAPAARRGGETDEQFAERIRLKDVPAGLPSEVIRKADIPHNRRFRDAWRKAGRGVTVDVTAAKGIVLADVRAERTRRLDESDKEKIRLDEVGTPQEQKALREKRQALRDLPAIVEAQIAVMTAEQLEAYQVAWPA